MISILPFDILGSYICMSFIFEETGIFYVANTRSLSLIIKKHPSFPRRSIFSPRFPMEPAMLEEL